MALWKRLVLVSASFGVGVVVAIAAIWAGITWHESHKTWDSNALKGTFATMEFDTRPDQDSYVMKFFYDLQNNTTQNYQLNANGFTVMAYLSKGNVLSKDASTYGHSDITVDDGPPFVPAKSKVRITLRTTYDYPSEFSEADKGDAKKVLKNVNLRLDEVNGFVLFDNQNRYRIELPKSWDNSTDAKGQHAEDQPKFTIESPDIEPPDKGDVSNRAAACEATNKMVAACKAKNIRPSGKSGSELGWFDVPLPRLGQSKDAFVPSQKACDIVIQWQNFCQSKH
jgi:hypothetical protein